MTVGADKPGVEARSLLRNNTEALGENLQGAYLSGQITDLQSRLNVLNLVQDGRVHTPTLQAFGRLFEALQLPPAELLVLVAQLQAALAAPETATNTSAGNAPHPLLPRSTDQLAWLGLSAGSVARLAIVALGGWVCVHVLQTSASGFFAVVATSGNPPVR